MNTSERSDSASALWYEAAGQAALRAETLAARGEGQALCQALWSGISRGTERLVFRGMVPESEHERMRCPYQAGSFTFPVKYGYAMVARVETGPEAIKGRDCFILHPHQSRFVADAASLHPLPEGLPARRACLAPNMETALNIFWDAEVLAGDRVTVIGGGVVGLLTAALAAGVPGTEVSLSDTNPARADLGKALGFRFVAPDAIPDEQDVVIHASGQPQGLRAALAAAGNNARVVEASWFGERRAELALGGSFHSRRLQIISSQVGQIPPRQQPRWNYARRLGVAMSLLCAPRFDALITNELAFQRVTDDLSAALADDAPGLMTVLRYDGA